MAHKTGRYNPEQDCPAWPQTAVQTKNALGLRAFTKEPGTVQAAMGFNHHHGPPN